jgi:hypothetical protein
MKKTILYFKTTILAATMLTLLGGCNDDLNLVEFGEEKPIIYGFLSMADTATYIRVERSFVDTKRGAPEIAQIPDSLYYSNATVTLVKVRTNERFVLQRVDGNREGYPREEGPFAKSPNWLYKIKNSTLEMRSDETYRVEIQRAGAREPFAVASTKIVGTYEIFAPDSSIPMVIDREDRTFLVNMLTKDKTAKLYAVRVIFNYDDVTSSGTRTPRNVVWNMVQSETRRVPPPADPTQEQQITFRVSAKDFYEYLARTIPPPVGVSRSFKSMDIQLDAGGVEFEEALNVGIANLGITGSQTIPTYSNVTNPKGDAVIGFGVFSSRNRITKRGILLNDQSLEFLKNGTITKGLNFR